jgi:hypothetical protein
VIRLGEEAREVALAEAQAISAMAVDDGYRDRLAALVGAASDGEVGDEEVGTLQELLELGLQSGRIRALYGPGGEQAALALYRRLPRGVELVASTREVSAALTALAGRELSSVDLRAVGPGAFALSLSAGEVELSVRLDRQGARLASVGV